MTKTDPLISFSEISLSFSSNLVLSNLSCDVNKGDKILLLGANASGKSTFLEIVAGLLDETSGKIENNVKGSINYLGHKLQLYSNWSILENMTYRARLLSSENAVERTIDKWELSKFRNRSISELSRGLKQRVALANTLIKESELLLLDEPTTALDNHSTRILTNFLKKNLDNKESTSIIVSHDIENLKETCNRVLVIHDKKIATDSNNTNIEDALNFYKKINK